MAVKSQRRLEGLLGERRGGNESRRRRHTAQSGLHAVVDRCLEVHKLLRRDRVAALLPLELGKCQENLWRLTPATENSHRASASALRREIPRRKLGAEPSVRGSAYPPLRSVYSRAAPP